MEITILRTGITNNTTANIPFAVMGNYLSNGIAGATTEYRYDFSSFVITNENYVKIQYRTTEESEFSESQEIEPNGGSTVTSLQQVVDGLNSLNLATFFLETDDINTYIVTYNDNYVFGQVEVGSNLLNY